MGDILKDEKNTKEKEKYYRALKLRLEVLHKKRKLPICLGIITAIIFSMLFYVCAFDTYMYTKHNSVIIISLFIGLAMGVVMVIYAKIYLDVKERYNKTGDDKQNRNSRGISKSRQNFL